MGAGRRFDFGGADALSGDLDGVVAAPQDVPEVVLVAQRPVAVDPDAGPAGPVRLLVAGGVLPEAAGHARPGVGHHQLSNLAPYGFALLVEDIDAHSRYGGVEAAWLDRLQRDAAEDPAGDLGPPAVVDDRTAASADVPEVPLPRRRVPRLAGAPENAEAGQIVPGGDLVTMRHQGADRSGR